MTDAQKAKVATNVKDPEAYYQTNYARREVFEKTIDKAGITLDTEGGADMALNRYDLAAQKRLKDWTGYVMDQVRAKRCAADGRAELDHRYARMPNSGRSGRSSSRRPARSIRIGVDPTVASLAAIWVIRGASCPVQAAV